MKICCDENISRSIVDLLRQEGHDVCRVQDEIGLATADPNVIAWCREHDRVLFTNDDDFFAFDTHPGILFLDDQRTPPRDVATAVQRLDRVVPELADRVWHVPDGWT